MNHQRLTYPSKPKGISRRTGWSSSVAPTLGMGRRANAIRILGLPKFFRELGVNIAAVNFGSRV